MPGKEESVGLLRSRRKRNTGVVGSLETLHEIGGASLLDKPIATIRVGLLPSGGIPPKARRRSRLALQHGPRRERHLERNASGSVDGARSPDTWIRADFDGGAGGHTRHGGSPAIAALRQMTAWESAAAEEVPSARRTRGCESGGYEGSKLILGLVRPSRFPDALEDGSIPRTRGACVPRDHFRSLSSKRGGVLKEELMDHLRTKEANAFARSTLYPSRIR